MANPHFLILHRLRKALLVVHIRMLQHVTQSTILGVNEAPVETKKRTRNKFIYT
jgi:hypothetical protein